jgi:DNA-binding Lrp family transcriptional regulator
LRIIYTTRVLTTWPQFYSAPDDEKTADVPHVLQAQRLIKQPDYLLRIVARDLAAFQQLYDDRLATLPGVQQLTSTLVMKSVVENRPLPL